MWLWLPAPNWWIGVRIPWTFADRELWDRSWRLASRILVIMAINALWSWKAFVITLAHLVVLSCAWPVFLYRRKYGTCRYWKDAGWLDYHPVARCRHCGHFQKLTAAAALAGARCEACGLPCRQGPAAGLRKKTPTRPG
jgi:hypothetical protein